MTQLDEFLQDLEKTISNYKRLYQSNEKGMLQRTEIYDNILKSKTSSRELKGVASLSKVNEYGDQARLAGELAILCTLQRLALNVKILQTSIDNRNEQLVESGVLEKVKDVEKIKELQEEIAKLKMLETEWQPYIDAIKQAIAYKRKWLEENR